MMAWATLLTRPSYLMGVRALRASLARTGSEHPFVVMVTADIDAETRTLLGSEGCVVRPVETVRPAADLQASYANPRFAEVWTKLAVWGLTEYERVVFLDADMLVTQNMDELFTLELGRDQIAACHACRCNPNRIPSYPSSWTPENCHYTHTEGVPTQGADPSEDYLNGGLLVVRPDEAVSADLRAELARVPDLSRYPFAEQDFLNDYFRARWQPLPYIYNALKTLPFQHPSLWDPAAVKNIHYIIDKPWQKTLQPDDRYYHLDKIWWDVARDIQPAGAR